MRVRYIHYIDDHNKELVKWDGEDPDMDDSDPNYWDGYAPNIGEQVYFATYGLYEVIRIRLNFTTPSTSVLEVKLSFIRKDL